MIVRTTRKNDTLIGRIFGSTTRRFAARQFAATDFLDEDRFQFELFKEIYRSDRRSECREFGLIRIVFQGPDKNREEIADTSMAAFREQLRVTDSVGWYESSLAFLLPETDKEGTLQIANAIAAVAEEQNLTVDTEVSIYPWDDELIALSDEIKRLSVHRDDSSRPNFTDQNKGTRSGPVDLNDTTTNDESDDGDPVDRSSAKAVPAKHSFVKSLPTPWWKRLIDIAGAGTGLLILSPLFVGAAVAIKATSAGPVFFLQMREGKNGQPFGIYKFRTMVADAELRQAGLRIVNEQDGPAFKLTNDPRVTPIGKYLRMSCVDELPQLFNILRGQMSLVGPRPLPLNESYACAAWQRARLTVLPGLTCTWQISGRREVTFAQWMQMDLDYIERRSFWLDSKLILETAAIAMMHRGSV